MTSFVLGFKTEASISNLGVLSSSRSGSSHARYHTSQSASLSSMVDIVTSQLPLSQLSLRLSLKI
jgi:hypothetical protein